MAKKASPSGSGGTVKKGSAKKKAGEAKARAPRKSAKAAAKSGNAGRKSEPAARETARQEEQQQPRPGAADAVVKLLESPLVVDLIAVGATAALAAITEQRFGRRSDEENAPGAVKAAGKAAAAAMGRRIATEVDEIMKASKEARDGEEG